MDEAKLKRLIRMVEESDIEELEIGRPFGGRIRITNKRANAGVPVAAAPAPMMVAAPAAPAPQLRSKWTIRKPDCSTTIRGCDKPERSKRNTAPFASPR